MAVKVFIVGATGYQGSTLVEALLAEGSKYEISALVRSKKSGEKLEAKGVKLVLGDFSNAQQLQQGASDADVVFSLASADDLEPVQALVNALKPTGKQAFLIHTSGTSVLADESKSEFASDKVYTDANIEEVYSLPASQMHKNVDDWIRSNASDISWAIVSPPLIYGKAGDPKRTSVQIPMITRAMVGTKAAKCVGAGKGMWNCVHVQDLARFYVALLDAMVDGVQHAGGYYFCEAGEFAWKDLFQAVAQRLADAGVLGSSELQGQFSATEMQEHMMGETTWGVVGNNARCKAARASELGWRPSHEPLMACVARDVDNVLDNIH